MGQDAAPFVELRAAWFSYGREPALRGVDLDLRAGEIHALLGPNGAGKTSLLRLIAGRIAPDRGTVRVASGDPHRSRATRRLIGWVPQEIALYPRLTVQENVDIFARLAGLSRRERRLALPLVLERTSTGEVADRLVGSLSGGYQRRVNIAASLVTEPHLILLDEPTQGVDLEARETIHAVLARLRAAGVTILVSTHDFSEVERLADRVAILHAGRVLREGALSQLLRSCANAAPEHEVRLEARPGSVAETALRRRGFVPLANGVSWRANGLQGDLEGGRLLAALREEGVSVGELRVHLPGLDTLYRDTLAQARSAVAPGVCEGMEQVG